MRWTILCSLPIVLLLIVETSGRKHYIVETTQGKHLDSPVNIKVEASSKRGPMKKHNPYPANDYSNSNGGKKTNFFKILPKIMETMKSEQFWNFVIESYKDAMPHLFKFIDEAKPHMMEFFQKATPIMMKNFQSSGFQEIIMSKLFALFPPKVTIGGKPIKSGSDYDDYFSSTFVKEMVHNLADEYLPKIISTMNDPALFKFLDKTIPELTPLFTDMLRKGAKEFGELLKNITPIIIDKASSSGLIDEVTEKLDMGDLVGMIG